MDSSFTTQEKELMLASLYSKARDDFYCFAVTISKLYDPEVKMDFPSYKMLCDIMQPLMENRLFIKTNQGLERVDTCFLNACPGWGKSYAVTRLLNIWWFGKHHKLQYTITANEKNRKKIMDDIRILLGMRLFNNIFDDFVLVKNNDGEKVTSKNGWLNMNPSRSDITGSRGDLFIIDDFFKPTQINRAEHESSKDFLSRYMTRGFKNPKKVTKRIIVEQRICQDDATGYLTDIYDKGNIPYLHIKIPYIYDAETTYEFYIQDKDTGLIEKKEYTFAKGSFSSPYFSNERYERMLWEEYKGSYARRETECQQIVTNEEDVIISKKDFKFYAGDWKDIPLKKLFITSDGANKDGRHNDYSVFMVWGLSNANNLYLIDVKRGKWLFPELLTIAGSLVKQYKQVMMNSQSYIMLNKFYVEDHASGVQLLHIMKSHMKNDGLQVNLVPLIRNKNKYERFSGVLLEIKQGLIYLPHNESFTDDLVNEISKFRKDNKHKNDDMVDCLIDAIQYELVDNKIGFDYSKYINSLIKQ